jgi:hypothetical protein
MPPLDQRLPILLQVAVERGLHSAAVDDVMRRAHEFLQTAPEDLDQTTLNTWKASLDNAPHLFAAKTAPPAQTTETKPPPDIPAWLSPTEKLTRARAHQQGTSGRGDSPPRGHAASHPGNGTTPEAPDWDKITDPAARLTAYREWQQQQQHQQQQGG